MADLVGFDHDLVSNMREVSNFGDFVDATSFEDYPYKIKILINENEEGRKLEHLKAVDLTYVFYSTKEQKLLGTTKMFQNILSTFKEMISNSG
jgi:hypothetical protein